MDSRMKARKEIISKIIKKDDQLNYIQNKLQCSDLVKACLVEEKKIKKKFLSKTLSRGQIKKTVKRVNKVMCIFPYFIKK